MIRTAKGIEGIRAFRAKNASGWHVYVDDQSWGYFPLTVAQIFEKVHYQLGAATFLGWTGNGLAFTTTTPQN